MYKLDNDQLTVSVLDPVADQERFGVRYCTGGYIFQIDDAKRGALLTGPTYPNSFDWFNGQGIPDAFNLSPLREPTATDAEALIIGIGTCDLAERIVLSFCAWEIEASHAAIRMTTQQAYGEFDLELERTVSLCGRTVRSHTRLANRGRWPLPIRWFPHPFFPQPDTDELCRLNIPVTFSESPGFEMSASGFISRLGWPWKGGFYQALDHDAQTNLVVLQRHPALGMIAATCSYVPALFPIWGNPNTFSWEPFYERTLAPGQETTWWIDYCF